MEELLIEENTKIIEGKYFIGLDMPLKHKFIIDLSANIPGDNLNGEAKITIKSAPPIKIENRLKGDYKYVCIVPEACHILLTAKGYPIGTSKKDFKLCKPVEPIFHLRIILSHDWKSGVANYDYKNSQGEWKKVTDATVQRI